VLTKLAAYEAAWNETSCMVRPGIGNPRLSVKWEEDIFKKWVFPTCWTSSLVPRLSHAQTKSNEKLGGGLGTRLLHLPTSSTVATWMDSKNC